MWAVASPRLWVGLLLAAVLAFSHGMAYRSGRAAVRAAWDKERAAQLAQALTDSEYRRNRERALSLTNEGITNAYVKEKTRLLAAARAADDRLRELESALNDPGGADTATTAGTDDPRGTIISQCAAALAILDNDFKNLASKTRALQDYASKVCVSP